jgi:aryl-alcohol dehydrogenase-like predicted oxidoreductase
MWRDGRALLVIGAMRLSTESTRNDEQSVAVLQAAFDAGVTLVDTADAYALDDHDVGHNERLIARALATWRGDAATIEVITKGGLTRPEGRWRPDGRARHLRAACQASRTALGIPRIAIYQLHAPDPRVAFTTSVRALAALAREGHIGAVGLCNVTVRQIEAARAIVPIASVQAELSPWRDRVIDAGVFEYCLAHDIRLLAFRPFGGIAGARRIASDPVLNEIAAAAKASPFALVLAWMRGLAPQLVPLPGPTRVDTARDCGRGSLQTLSDTERIALDRHFPIGKVRTPAPLPPRPQSAASMGGDDDIVMIMGLPGSGKSTRAADLVADGYERLNRDEAGGTLAALVPRLESLLSRGAGRVVLDNTYLTRASRRAIIDAARAHGRSVRGLWIDASPDEAQVNIVWRMLQTHGRLLTDHGLRHRRAPDRLSPSALFRAQREAERPDIGEGFASLEVVPFRRRADPALRHRALVLWCDGVIRPVPASDRSGNPLFEEAELAARRTRLASYQAEGWRLLAISWEPQISERGVSAAEVDAGFVRLRQRLGLDIEFHYCPHGAGPPVCWCRKPLPGLGVLLVHRHQLDPQQCLYVGRSPQDPLFARRLGFRYRAADEFFAEQTRANTDFAD